MGFKGIPWHALDIFDDNFFEALLRKGGFHGVEVKEEEDLGALYFVSQGDHKGDHGLEVEGARTRGEEGVEIIFEGRDYHMQSLDIALYKPNTVQI